MGKIRRKWAVERIRHRRALASAAAACALALAGPAPAADGGEGQEPGSSRPIDEVVVTARHYDNGVGTSDAASEGTIRAELVASRPALRTGEVLEFVPGMVVTQHSGDGKANQYFLRGFNLDHGTDFATFVNGLPVNMPTHAHGQGYSDLNFLIPELIDHVDYRKGPYFAQAGDFASAGTADIAYRTTLERPFAAATGGGHGYGRLVAAGAAPMGDGLRLLAAGEIGRNDGPWVHPEQLNKANGVMTLAAGTATSGWSTSLMGYQAHWNSTDQVPQRLLDAHSYQGRPFGRFDTVDPNDGGETSRSSLSGEWHRLDANGATRVAAYAIDYRLALFSNFTYALERPVTGDQFSQQERRRAYGASASHAFDARLGALPVRWELGASVRHDRIHVGLYDARLHVITGITRDDRVQETIAGLYGQAAVQAMPWLRAIAGVRADAFDARVDSLANAANSGASRDHRLSPKLTLVGGPWARTEVFVNAGRGLHSNDARGTTARVDPKSGDPVDRVPGLVSSRGLELGLRGEWLPGLQTSLALWRLDFDSELLFVGDAGTTEASRPSTRRGIEFNNHYVAARWLLVDADLAWTRARFADADPVGDRIPNAVDRVAALGLTVRDLGPWQGSLQWRYLGPGALIEDGSVRSRSSLTANLRVARRLGRSAELSLDVFNLFDRKVDDIEYWYESRLAGEPAPVAGLHVHPGEPRNLRVTLRWNAAQGG